jgi:hypothetical protein
MSTRPVLLWDEVDQVAGEIESAALELDRLSAYAKPYDETFACRLKSLASEAAALHTAIHRLNTNQR